jgi:hypothetical protein
MTFLNRKGKAVTTNTPTSLAENAEDMIESDLAGDCESASVVTPNSEIEGAEASTA